MTDRFKGVLVTFDRDIRWDDAKAILASLKMINGKESVMEWISVKDRLPAIDDWVIARGSNRTEGITALVQYCYNDHIKMYFWNLLSSGCGCCDTSLKNVTHWMPEPKPPEE